MASGVVTPAATPLAHPYSARLHSPPEYAAALSGRRAARGALFVLMSARGARPAPDAGAGARLGLIIPKRMAPLAVTRNAIKRVLREAFRHRRPGLPPVDLVFRLVARCPETSLSALKRQVRAEADRLLARV